MSIDAGWSPGVNIPLKKLNENFIKATTTTNWTRVIMRTVHHYYKAEMYKEIQQTESNILSHFLPRDANGCPQRWLRSEQRLQSSVTARRTKITAQDPTEGNGEPSGTDPYLRSESEVGTSPHQTKAHSLSDQLPIGWTWQGRTSSR